jgi:hypothetical protein
LFLKNPAYTAIVTHRITLLSNATGRRGVACTIVKITVKEFTPFVMLAVDWTWICDSDTLL